MVKLTKVNKAAMRNRRPTIRGQGDYTPGIRTISDPLHRIEAKLDFVEDSINRKPSVNKVASNIGKNLGSLVGQGDLGQLAGSRLAKFFGHGDYNVKSNSLVRAVENTKSVPSFQKARGTRIREREFLMDIRSGATLDGGSTAFNNDSFILNPTNSKSFPWLSQVASLYDQWEPNGIIFEFVSTSSEFNGSNQALGAVVMATDYDPYDPDYLSKQEMENSDYSCSTKPSENLMHGIECAASERPTELLFTERNSTAVPLTNTQLGKFQLATKGCSAVDVVLGELWISYDITFFKKQQSIGVTGPFLYQNGSLSATANLGWLANPTTNTGGNNVSIAQNIGVGNTVTITSTRVGENYLLIYDISASGAFDDTALLFDNFIGCTPFTANTAGAGGNPLIIYQYIQITGSDVSFTMPLRPSATAGDWFFDVLRVNP